MSKDELFKKYKIDQSHATWDDAVDNWFSIEIYRRMHDEQLPPPDDESIAWVLDFLDKTNDAKYFFSLDNPGSHFLTAKRMVHRHADAILKELAPNQPNPVRKEREQ
ncbi:hypothetical protein UFOVP253_9 [uncultured Caudovirales phage]|uniref:Uncharacterized protein n=1 Tax=uncultured Caudovirales phage TaxID=2100421 RepID=A0A6J5LH02_9CAUD|nr:hypothetical protein UFOVP253_9 [uncultured Caudovirales phage]